MKKTKSKVAKQIQGAVKDLEDFKRKNKNIKPITAKFAKKIKKLVKGVEVDLEKPLPSEKEDLDFYKNLLDKE